ncbi:MAG: McrB family protein [Eubacteriaceae bacterium]
MKWSMDTHKYMSEITRKALKIMAEYNATSQSTAEEIEAVERKLVEAGIYRDYESARGRIRRALFTYFKAYGCMSDNESLTEMGKAFVDEKISIQEFSFWYVLNYKYVNETLHCYPAQMILKSLTMLKSIGNDQAYISAYDFSQLIECESIDDVSEEFISRLISQRNDEIPAVNERSIGFDVWAKMLVQAGILVRTPDRHLKIRNMDLIDWILLSYDSVNNVEKGVIITGVLENLPVLPLGTTDGEIQSYKGESAALQAFLFDNINEHTIDKYILRNPRVSFEEMKDALGLNDNNVSYYNVFIGLERLVGYNLINRDNALVRTIGEILLSVELSEESLDEINLGEEIDYDNIERLKGGSNVLLYGVPGSGKSWTIEHEYCNEGSIVERLVFLPDYTNADFVGQILPVVDKDKQVTYEFTPGPFTKILCNAYRNPMHKYILIIEEINRGNAPAIFGEIFQLLDRKIEMQRPDDGFPVGTSEYGITHKYMAEFIYGNEAHKVRIPSNLFIIGTMNTSDQNVFTLDTAFQRRWKMRLIENNFENVRLSLADAEILDTGVTWKHFCETVNKIIIGNKTKMVSAEDKRLGIYFVHESELKFDNRALPSSEYSSLLTEHNALIAAENSGSITEEQKSRLTEIREAAMINRLFPEKVIKYLWDDAFKFNPEALFETDNMDDLEKVIRTFVYSNGEERFKIFKQTVRDTLFTGTQQ